MNKPKNRHRNLRSLMREGSADFDPVPARQPVPDVKALVEALRRSFPLLDDEGLDEDEHHCEWSIQQERKRLHMILAPYRKGGEA